MGNKNVEKIIALGERADPDQFAVFIRYLADNRGHWPIALRVLNGTDLGRRYLRRAKQLRPALALEGDEFDIRDLANTFEAAALLDQLISDSTYVPDAPDLQKWAWWRHWGYPPGNHPVYRIMVEIAHLKEQRRDATVAKLERIGVVRRLIEREWELERYSQWRERMIRQTANLLAAARLVGPQSKIQKKHRKPSPPKGT